jgi:hypothetical protein
LWALPLKNLQKKDEPFLLEGTGANEAMPQISPDGRWLAYQSDATNQWEVYVHLFLAVRAGCRSPTAAVSIRYGVPAAASCSPCRGTIS